MLIQVIDDAWGWLGVCPARIEATNMFGNVIFVADDGSCWRICPEELACKQIARNTEEFKNVWDDEEFQQDWRMDRLVALAEQHLGVLAQTKCYCLKVPAVLGGEYAIENIGAISRTELVSFAGHVAEQIKNIPEGGHIQFRFLE
ncbi:MAG: T6SS immunity protein Tdi1 domain-containing protein [Phycisphaerales bacterium]